MAYADLREFLRVLEKDDELRHVTAPVDTHLEVTEIVTRLVRAGGPAVVFDRPVGSALPLAMNVFGTMRRMALALGVDDVGEIGERIGALVRPEVPHGFAGLRESLGKLASLRGVPPKSVKSGPCQEIVKTGAEVDLYEFPALHTWPDDGGAFFNLGLTHTRHPTEGTRNVGLYRLQRHDHNTIGMHWQIHKDSRAHHAVAERLGQRLPVAIAFGCDPVLTYTATAPLPGIDEYLFAGFIRKDRVELVPCKTVPLEVPATAQVVFEGWLEPGVRRPEGPYGDHTGFYTPAEPFPALTVDCVTMQREAIFQSIVVGAPPQEDGPLGKATERIFLPLIKMTVPEIVDYDLPVEGVFHNCAIVSIDKRYPKQAHKVMNAIWGAGLLSLTKLVVVVDADCDVHDYREVAWRAFGNVDYSHDLLTTVGPVDHLDHASYQQFWGGKAGIDATRKLPTEGYDRGWPEMIVQDPAVVARVTQRWPELGL
ncbi:MAG: menaquinone biosynthesis decarboxylase [Mycobacteriales bacterium]|nr:menaquinone biosynthesis decarboxylase [Frankia sp.]